MSNAIKRTYKGIKGWDWEIRTSKNSRGQIECRADAKKISSASGGFSISEWGMDHPAILLARSEGVMRATEKTLNEYHRAGVRKFEAMRDADELPENKEATADSEENALPLYCKLQTAGYGDYPAVIIGTEKNAYSGKTQYKVLVLDSQNPRISTNDRIKPLSEKFGIGIYYLDSKETYTEAEILPLIQKAEEIAAEKARIREEQEAEAARIKAEGLRLWPIQVPAWAKAVIVAESIKDHSNIYTDYFHASAAQEKTLVLAFSASTVNNEQELRRAARNHEDTTAMADTAELDKSRYRLQTSWNSGYHIRKVVLTSDYEESHIVMALGRGNNFAPVTDQPEEVSNKAGVRIILNEAKGGIEIHFSGKPADEVLEDLKRNGFRWARFNKCWYKANTAAARAIAQKYGDIPGSGKDEAAGMIEAQENAMIDNWAARNL